MLDFTAGYLHRIRTAGSASSTCGKFITEELLNEVFNEILI